MGLIFIGACTDDVKPFCTTPDIVGNWWGDYQILALTTGQTSDTIIEVSKEFAITFLEDNEGFYDGTNRYFNWYFQCSPKNLVISEETDPSGPFYYTVSHPCRYVDSDSINIFYGYLDSADLYVRYIQISYTLVRQ